MLAEEIKLVNPALDHKIFKSWVNLQTMKLLSEEDGYGVDEKDSAEDTVEEDEDEEEDEEDVPDTNEDEEEDEEDGESGMDNW